MIKHIVMDCIRRWWFLLFITLFCAVPDMLFTLDSMSTVVDDYELAYGLKTFAVHRVNHSIGVIPLVFAYNITALGYMIFYSDSFRGVYRVLTTLPVTFRRRQVSKFIACTVMFPCLWGIPSVEIELLAYLIGPYSVGRNFLDTALMIWILIGASAYLVALTDWVGPQTLNRFTLRNFVFLPGYVAPIIVAFLLGKASGYQPGDLLIDAPLPYVFIFMALPLAAMVVCFRRFMKQDKRPKQAKSGAASHNAAIEKTDKPAPRASILSSHWFFIMFFPLLMTGVLICFTLTVITLCPIAVFTVFDPSMATSPAYSLFLGYAYIFLPFISVTCNYMIYTPFMFSMRSFRALPFTTHHLARLFAALPVILLLINSLMTVLAVKLSGLPLNLELILTSTLVLWSLTYFYYSLAMRYGLKGRITAGVLVLLCLGIFGGLQYTYEAILKHEPAFTQYYSFNCFSSQWALLVSIAISLSFASLGIWMMHRVLAKSSSVYQHRQPPQYGGYR